MLSKKHRNENLFMKSLLKPEPKRTKNGEENTFHLIVLKLILLVNTYITKFVGYTLWEHTWNTLT